MTKETAFQTLGISEDASPQEIKQAWRDMLAVWHPDKHMGNERLRRKAEEQTKRINEAYDRIQTGNFKSSSQNSHGSYQSERVRTVYVEKEKPVYIKKSSGFSKAFAGLAATGMVISMTMCANRDEHNRQANRQAYADFQYTISKLETENSRFQHLLDQNVATRTNIVYPKLQRVMQVTQAISERMNEYAPQKFSQSIVSVMDDILDAFKSASGEDEKQSVLVAARIAITSIISREWAYFENIYSCNESQLKQWVRATKRDHENYLKTGLRKEADAYQALQEQAAARQAAQAQAREVRYQASGPRRTKEQIQAHLDRLREEAARLHPIPPTPEEFQLQQAAAAERAAAAEQAQRAEAQQQAQESNGNQAMKENCPESPFRGERKVR